MSSSWGSRGCVPKFSSASTWIGCGAVFSWARMPRFASKRKPVRCRIWVPRVLNMVPVCSKSVVGSVSQSRLLVGDGLHQRKIALELHQVLAAVHQQGGAGHRCVFQRKLHRGCDVGGCGRAAQRRELVPRLKLLVAQQVAAECEPGR